MEPQRSSSANLSAQVALTPILSQSVLTAIILVSIIPLVAGFYFLWHDKDVSWIPFVIFFFLIVLVGIGWWRSQNSIDMGNANPTQIIDRNGNRLVTDTRVLESNNAISQLGILLQSVGARNPLPEPDGLVDASGKGVPGTKDKAKGVVEEINSTLSDQTQDLFESSVRNRSNVVQEVVNPPKESNEGALNHNQSDSDDSA